VEPLVRDAEPIVVLDTQSRVKGFTTVGQRRVVLHEVFGNEVPKLA